MIIKKYNIGEIIIKVECPFDYKDEEQFAKFITDKREYDYTVHVDTTEEFPDVIDKYDYQTDERICICEGENLTIYYKDRDNRKGYYARRILEGVKKECKLTFTKSFSKILTAKNLFGVIGIEEIAAANDAVILHSSYVNVNGFALIFTGPCGMGKSTQADLWKKYRNAQIVNGDKTLLYKKNGIAMAGAIMFCGTSKICENINLPIKAIVELRQEKSNKAFRYDNISSFVGIYRGCYPIPYSKTLTNKQMDIVQTLSACVSSYRYGCLPDESAVNYLEETIWETTQNL